MIAWLMLPIKTVQRALLLVGEGANGKSTFLKGMRAFLGSQNITAKSLHKLEGNTFATDRLRGKLANICPDLPSNDILTTDTFKALTGDDQLIDAEAKFKTSYEMDCFCRLVFAANQMPKAKHDSSDGFYRRWFAVPFPNTFAANPQKGRELELMLTHPRELSGVLNRALAALDSVLTVGLTETDSIRETSEEMRAETDPMAEWLENECLEHPKGWILKDDMRKAFKLWCQDNKHPVPNEGAFGKRLLRHRPMIETRKMGRIEARCYVGITFKAKSGAHESFPQSSNVLD